ncbi:Peptide chain release factor 1 [Caldithrix abyssi DSM 13497]|uniref:Peptide chain release factor 1 n=1 Tax=Caldithrix abyssi DSM 13497 TaxID=880073 RepID=H1XU52_CALAY|nr:peptide chain release factor 1 [Caldithrix abyssi]APF17441.1 prfA bacterial peptide chain release factor 1 (bRF-1) [Caldithrix abyssi DSM 13497]EHO41542.1 Peptide chain release factor 1 [Caldithrix abyssi DSM 13497]
MKEKIQALQKRLDELNKELSDPSVFNDQGRYKQLSREHSEISKILEIGAPYLKALEAYEENKAIIEEDSDPELAALAKEENEDLEKKIADYEEKLKLLLIPKDPDDAKNAIVEIRAGTGGDEAAIFAGDLYRMYTRYCEDHGFKIDVMSSTPSERGGFKEIIFMVEGPDAYGTLKYESGVHRVQRVPETETQGRVHTSAASVAVLPEAEEVDVEIDPNELRIDVFRSSGPGGQSVNTTDSAVRITHIPTGLVVTCQDEKSQHKNKAKALKVLRTRLLDMAMQEQRSAIDAQRKSMVGSGDRSAKIRTYNFPQGRVTDHRIGLTLYKLDRIMEGDLDELIEALHLAARNEKLQEEYEAKA